MFLVGAGLGRLVFATQNVGASGEREGLVVIPALGLSIMGVTFRPVRGLYFLTFPPAAGVACSGGKQWIEGDSPILYRPGVRPGWN